MASSFTANQFESSAELAEGLDRLFREGIFGTTAERAAETRRVASNLLETWASYFLQIALPGAEHLEIDVVARQVVVTGKYHLPTIESATFIRSETENRAFREVFELPAEVDGDNAEAHYDRGILTLRLPKVAHLKPKSIKVQMP